MDRIWRKERKWLITSLIVGLDEDLSSTFDFSDLNHKELGMTNKESFLLFIARSGEPTRCFSCSIPKEHDEMSNIVAAFGDRIFAYSEIQYSLLVVCLKMCYDSVVSSQNKDRGSWSGTNGRTKDLRKFRDFRPKLSDQVNTCTRPFSFLCVNHLTTAVIDPDQTHWLVMPICYYIGTLLKCCWKT